MSRAPQMDQILLQGVCRDSVGDCLQESDPGLLAEIACNKVRLLAARSLDKGYKSRELTFGASLFGMIKTVSLHFILSAEV